MRIFLGADVAKLAEKLNDFQKKQVPFAASKALNAVAKIVKEKEIEQLDKDLDRPTPFTKRGFYTRNSSKRRLVAVVGVKDLQANYLRYQIKGGTRKPLNKALLSPVNIRLNKYGNMGRKKIATELAKPRVFSANIKGTAGIWRRLKRKPKLLVKYKSEQKYRSKRFRFEYAARTTAKKEIAPEFNKALLEALRTAK